MHVVVIPAYQPDETLVRLCQEIAGAIPQRPVPKIIVVDDGSTTVEASTVFIRLREMLDVKVLMHEYNRGKGAALKTAFAYILESLPDVTSIVTADADGQHLSSDILAVARCGQHTGEIVLGVRTFDSDVPLRSRLGNKLTRTLFRLFVGIDLSDTQTGLRAIPRRELVGLLAIPYDRYNFEFEALIEMVLRGKFHQVPIQTVYRPGNSSSHFNPVLDSVRIYAVLFRHISLIAIVAVGDVLLFSMFSLSGLPVLTSLLCSRTISTLIYFLVARQVVFRAKGNLLLQITLFLLLVAGNIALLAPFISIAHDQLGVPQPIAMVFGNSFLYISNFLWQNEIIFRRSSEEQ